jgi:hypothetical protein
MPKTEDIVGAQIAKLEKQIESFEGMRAFIGELQELSADFPGISPIVLFNCLGDVVMDVHPRGTLGDVAPLLGRMREHGWKRLNEIDCEEANSRLYTYTRKPGERVRISVYFGKSESCRYVQTGTKEVGVYELRCSGTD